MQGDDKTRVTPKLARKPWKPGVKRRGRTGTKLTERQRAFVDAFCVGHNATEAAIAAGYGPKFANRRGYELKLNPRVMAAIEAREAELAKALEMDAIEWRRRIAQLARFDVRKLFDPETGKLRPVHELPDDVAGCVASVKVLREKTTRRTEGGIEQDVEESIAEVKAWDVARALEMAGKCLGQLKDAVDVNHRGRIGFGTDEKSDDELLERARALLEKASTT